MKRFSDKEGDDILHNKYSKKTIYTDIYVKRMLQKYSDGKNIILDFNNVELCDKILSNFMASVNKLDGSNLTVSSINAIKYGLSRIFK